jgi:N-acetyl-gamma-glutamyl-phosphate reductase
MGHGQSEKFLKKNSLPDKVFLIDLSEDFRLKKSSTREFIYGLPELNRNSIKGAKNIANPGCFATAIQLALLPMAHSKFLNDDIHVSAITGSTGAGKSLTSTTHYTWRSANISLYNPFQHRHLKEIKRTVGLLQPEWENEICFIPFRGNFTRGIFASCYTKSDLKLGEIRRLYEEYYSEHPFVLISDKNPSMKAVINSNKCVLYLEKHGDTILIISMIDNLIKGASGQAVQNMNLMVGFDETCGLKFKSIGL